MSSALRSRQHWLPLSGPGEHFDLLHGGHRASVAVCTKGSQWQERVYAHDDARAMAVNLAPAADLNVYQSQAGFRADRRCIAHVVSLPSAFSDLDYYRVPELADLDAEAVLDRVLDALPWLPLPTLLFSSGRGAYLDWLFDKPLSPDRLGEWQAVQRVVADVLAHSNKMSVVALVSEGKARTFHVDRATMESVGEVLRRNVDKDTVLYTDESRLYKRNGKEFAGHETVRHTAGEYYRNGVTTNNCENYLSIFKRGMKGVYQHCSEKHLQRYLSEFDFRYNSRDISDKERAELAIKGAEGKRLMYA